MKLYEINEQLLQAMEGMEIDPDTGEILNYDALNSLNMEQSKKIEGIACFCIGLKAEADAIKTEEEKLKNRRNANEKTFERLREYIANSMNLIGKDKISTARVVVSFRNSQAVEIQDENILPDEFKRTKVEANKAEISKALKEGKEVPGAVMVKNRSLQIK